MEHRSSLHSGDRSQVFKITEIGFCPRPLSAMNGVPARWKQSFLPIGFRVAPPVQNIWQPSAILSIRASSLQRKQRRMSTK